MRITLSQSVKNVVPHAGTWIEIVIRPEIVLILEVVPHAGTWIEIIISKCFCLIPSVVPHAGTWIEIVNTQVCQCPVLSFPTRERGLKYYTG